MSKTGIIGLLLVCLLVVLVVGYTWVPGFRAGINTALHDVQKADDATRYATLKKVEDTCRAMMASYTADKLTWEQYKDHVGEEQRGWAEQAKLRANRTAAVYNTYILENSYVWEANVPMDIDQQLPYIQ